MGSGMQGTQSPQGGDWLESKRGRGLGVCKGDGGWAATLQATQALSYVYKHFIQFVIVGDFPAKCTDIGEVFLG